MSSFVMKILAEATQSQTFRRILISLLTSVLGVIGAKVVGGQYPEAAQAAEKLADLLMMAMGAFIASPIVKQTALNMGLPPAPADPQGVPGDVPEPPTK